MKRKVDNEKKSAMRKMRESGATIKEVAEKFKLSESTVNYHLSDECKMKTIARVIKNQKPRDRTEYNKKYHLKRYKNDPEFRERVKKNSRENWRKKNGGK